MPTMLSSTLFCGSRAVRLRPVTGCASPVAAIAGVTLRYRPTWSSSVPASEVRERIGRIVEHLELGGRDRDADLLAENAVDHVEPIQERAGRINLGGEKFEVGDHGDFELERRNRRGCGVARQLA